MWQSMCNELTGLGGIFSTAWLMERFGINIVCETGCEDCTASTWC